LTTVSSLGERALIQRITARLSMPSWVIVGPGDDAAVIAPPRGSYEVLTTDALVDGVHVDRRFVPPYAIGHRALAINLSDLAAMGAEPRAALLSLVLPDDLSLEEIDGILDGILALAGEHRVTLIGGNITHTSGPLTIDITAIGAVKPRRMLTRAGARVGDEVYVTGTLGDAATGLRTLQALAVDPIVDVDRCRARYFHPEPRVRAGVLLGRNRAATSCMDLSDGLADGIRQIAASSNVGIIVDAQAIPRSVGITLDAALSGGDDYELVFTVKPKHRGRLRGVRNRLGTLPVTRIGVVTRGHDVLLRTDAGVGELPRGYEHFR
jgi:thiamine-monophosphate kinase